MKVAVTIAAIDRPLTTFLPSILSARNMCSVGREIDPGKSACQQSPSMTAMGNATFDIKALFAAIGPLADRRRRVADRGIVVGTTTWWAIFRERALQSAERELDNTVLLLARHFDQHLEDFISIQRELRRTPVAQMASPASLQAADVDP